MCGTGILRGATLACPTYVKSTSFPANSSRPSEAGYDIGPGQLGGNITTARLDLEKMPLGTRIELGPTAVVELTGLRTPCVSSTASGPA
ncbi:MOSC domain-containing protein YiiM [Bradyrhizobium japonicum]|uniref:MOSC domain-containing protein YiiM n=1 Tax=Bradyrhizobium japonicum TaxID=375 RepID=A0ABV2RLU7_BRAJP